MGGGDGGWGGAVGELVGDDAAAGDVYEESAAGERSIPGGVGDIPGDDRGGAVGGGDHGDDEQAERLRVPRRSAGWPLAATLAIGVVVVFGPGVMLLVVWREEPDARGGIVCGVWGGFEWDGVSGEVSGVWGGVAGGARSCLSAGIGTTKALGHQEVVRGGCAADRAGPPERCTSPTSPAGDAGVGETMCI